MSTLKVDTILKRTGTGTITVGQSGDTISIPSGATLNSAGTNTLEGIDNTPAFESYLSSDQTLSNNTSTKITFDLEAFDTDSTFNTSNNRFTPAVSGKYYIYGRLIFNDGSVANDDTHHVQIYKNGSRYADIFTKANSRDPIITYNQIIDLDSDDYVEIYANINNSDGSRAIHGSSGTDNRFAIFGAYKLIGA